MGIVYNARKHSEEIVYVGAIMLIISINYFDAVANIQWLHVFTCMKVSKRMFDYLYIIIILSRS